MAKARPWAPIFPRRVVLGDRGMVFLRPVSFDFNFNDNGMILTYNLIMGGGVTW
jgi:hypothetical protein